MRPSLTNRIALFVAGLGLSATIAVAAPPDEKPAKPMFGKAPSKPFGGPKPASPFGSKPAPKRDEDDDSDDEPKYVDLDEV